MKRILLKILDFISFFWKIIPFTLRKIIINGILALESRGKPKIAISRLFLLRKFINRLINQRAVDFGNGIHPKQDIIKYHDFFINNIDIKTKSILDIGSGNGYVAYKIASKFENSEVVGIDINFENIRKSKNKFKLKNLDFVNGDVTTYKFNKNFDTIILSNVLEHIEKRVDFLIKVQQQIKPNQFLIRVPLFERSWDIPFQKKLGLNYFSDIEHFIEHTLLEFKEEISSSNLKIKKIEALWGEIWSVCES